MYKRQVGRDGCHWVWCQDCKADDNKSPIGIFDSVSSRIWTYVIMKENNSSPQHSLSLVLNVTAQFRKCFTIDLRCEACSRLHEIDEKHTLLVPGHSCHDFLVRLGLLEFFWCVNWNDATASLYSHVIIMESMILHGLLFQLSTNVRIHDNIEKNLSHSLWKRSKKAQSDVNLWFCEHLSMFLAPSCTQFTVA